MAGGRWGTPGAYAHNTVRNRSMEPTVFIDSTGSEGLNWTPHSMSFWHNTLADPRYVSTRGAPATPTRLERPIPSVPPYALAQSATPCGTGAR